MDSLNALLVACNYTHTVSVERLVRAAHFVANIYDDMAMADWCSAELQGTRDLRCLPIGNYRRS